MLLQKALLRLAVPFLMIAALLSAAPLPSEAQSSAPSQKADKKAAKLAAIKNMVESQNFVFKAQNAMPMAGRSLQLTTDYDVKVTKESIISYLPYFGRAYSAPLDPTKGGIQFTSKNFDYTLTPGKKDGWSILIKPKDYTDVQQMYMTISSTGYASVQVTSTSRQPISFTGIVTAPKSSSH